MKYNSDGRSGRKAHVRCGGARACALEPSCETTTEAVAACHTTDAARRSGIAKTACGASRDALAGARQQIEQLAACDAGAPERSLSPVPASPASWQIAAVCKGSASAASAAQQAAIGASTCIASASTRIGRNGSSHRRIGPPWGKAIAGGGHGRGRWPF